MHFLKQEIKLAYSESLFWLMWLVLLLCIIATGYNFISRWPATIADSTRDPLNLWSLVVLSAMAGIVLVMAVVWMYHATFMRRLIIDLNNRLDWHLNTTAEDELAFTFDDGLSLHLARQKVGAHVTLMYEDADIEAYVVKPRSIAPIGDSRMTRRQLTTMCELLGILQGRALERQTVSRLLAGHQLTRHPADVEQVDTLSS